MSGPGVDNSASIGQKLGISCQGGASWLPAKALCPEVYHPREYLSVGVGGVPLASNYTGELPSPQAVNKALKGSPSYSRLTTFFCLFWPHHTVACGILFPSIGMVHAPSAAEAWSLNHCTAREVPVHSHSNLASNYQRRVYETEALMWRSWHFSIKEVAGL